MRILVVEDQLLIREAVARRLRALGYAVDEAIDGGSAESFLNSYPYDVIVLDRLLSDGDALHMLQRWRQRSITVPTLFLTGCDQVADRVDGLTAGADDYLIKPFAMDELVARITVLGRRGNKAAPSMLKVADLEIDVGRREVRRGGILLPLRPKEYMVLLLLAERVGRVVSHREMISHCWGEDDEPLSNAEEVIIAALRRKLGSPPLLRTVRGAGYMLESMDAAERT